MHNVWHHFGPEMQALDRRLYDEAKWEDGDLERGARIYQTEFSRIARICAREKIRLAACIIPTADSVEALRAGATSSPSQVRT